MRRKLVAIAATALLVVACGDDDDGGGDSAAGSTSTEPSTTSTTAGSTTTAAPAADGTALTVVDSPFGSVLADADGVTLYAFTQDSDGQSACSGQCATTWPPLAAEGEPTGDDAVTGALGTIERDDGTAQVTIAGMPLYHFAPDAGASGSFQGQGIGGVWFVVAPDGTIVE